MRRGFKSWAEKEAARCRGILGLQKHDPLELGQLANELSIVRLAPSDLGLKPHHLEQLLQKDSNSWSGVTIGFGKSDLIIITNPTHSPARQASDLAHEVAHVLCEHISNKEECILQTGFPLRSYNEEQEEEAAWLGGCLLLPRVALLHTLTKNYSEEQIRAAYCVSADLLKYRINVTGVKRQIRSVFTSKKGAF